MGPYSLAHPKYLLSPEYPHPLSGSTSLLALYRSTRVHVLVFAQHLIRHASQFILRTVQTLKTAAKRSFNHSFCSSFVEQPASYYQRVKICHNL